MVELPGTRAMHVLHIVQVIDGEVEGEWHQSGAVYCSRSLRETSTELTLSSMSRGTGHTPCMSSRLGRVFLQHG